MRYKSVADMKIVGNTIFKICGQAEYTARNWKHYCVPNNDTRTGMFIFNLFNTETRQCLRRIMLLVYQLLFNYHTHWLHCSEKAKSYKTRNKPRKTDYGQCGPMFCFDSPFIMTCLKSVYKIRQH